MAVGAPLGAVAGVPTAVGRGWKMPAAIALVVAVVVAAAAYGGVWLFGPRALQGAGAAAVSASVAPGHPVFVGDVASPVHEGTTLDLRSIAPVVVRNTSRAVIRMVVCHLRGATGIGTAGPATVRASCDSLQPFRPGDYRLAFRNGDEILMRVTPRRSGVVRVAKFAVTYRQGMRYGRQYTGVSATVHS